MGNNQREATLKLENLCGAFSKISAYSFSESKREGLKASPHSLGDPLNVPATPKHHGNWPGPSLLPRGLLRPPRTSWGWSNQGPFSFTLLDHSVTNDPAVHCFLPTFSSLSMRTTPSPLFNLTRWAIKARLNKTIKKPKDKDFMLPIVLGQKQNTSFLPITLQKQKTKKNHEPTVFCLGDTNIVCFPLRKWGRKRNHQKTLNLKCTRRTKARARDWKKS